MKHSSLSKKTVIIIPVYNGEKYIGRSLDSCLNQTQPTAVWVIDNQSTDRTRDIVFAYTKKDPRITLIVNEKNLGRIGNWNRCLEHFEKSEYAYIKFLFAGDELLPECIKRSEEMLAQDPELGAIAFAYEFVYRDGKTAISGHPEHDKRLFTPKEITEVNIGKGGLLGAIVCNVYAKKYTTGLRFNENFVSKLEFDMEVLAKSKAYYSFEVLARFNLDSHNTFDSANSSWVHLEFSFIEGRQLHRLQEMFTSEEAARLKERVIINSVERQYQFFGIRFLWQLLLSVKKQLCWQLWYDAKQHVKKIIKKSGK